MKSESFDPHHLAKFDEIIRTFDKFSARKAYKPHSRIPSAWAKKVAEKGGLDRLGSLPDERIDRDALFERLEGGVANLKQECAAIFAWGGMKIDNGVLAFRTFSSWQSTAEIIFRPETTREQAYARFHGCHRRGLGPAFFTKLIYFFGRQSMNTVGSYGYILDQWTARSVNLLTGERVINLSSGIPIDRSTKSGPRAGKTVTVENDARSYEEFCQIIDVLARRYCCAPDLIEEAMFSHGGRNKGEWRRYIIEKGI